MGPFSQTPQGSDAEHEQPEQSEECEGVTVVETAQSRERVQEYEREEVPHITAGMDLDEQEQGQEQGQMDDEMKMEMDADTAKEKEQARDDEDEDIDMNGDASDAVKADDAEADSAVAKEREHDGADVAKPCADTVSVEQPPTEADENTEEDEDEDIDLKHRDGEKGEEDEAESCSDIILTGSQEF